MCLEKRHGNDALNYLLAAGSRKWPEHQDTASGTVNIVMHITVIVMIYALHGSWEVTTMATSSDTKVPDPFMTFQGTQGQDP